MSTDDNEIVEQRGLWLEEFSVGTLYRHRPGRTVTEADNVIFTTLTMNTQPLHLDAVWSAEQTFGERLVNSLFTLSTLVGLSISQLTLGTLVANLGDTLYAESLITGARPSKSRPGEGVVEVQHIARNQHGVIVAQCHRVMLVQSRPVNN